MDEIITCYSSAAYQVKTVGAYTNKRKRYSLISKKVFDEPK